MPLPAPPQDSLFRLVTNSRRAAATGAAVADHPHGFLPRPRAPENLSRRADVGGVLLALARVFCEEVTDADAYALATSIENRGDTC